jgi:hypothetical protein
MAEWQPRNLSRIPSTTSLCTLHGLIYRGQLLLNYYDDVVTVYPPSRCGFDDPHAFCVVFNSTIHPSCEFGFGTPLTCDGLTTAGFVFEQNGCVRRNFTDDNGILILAPMMRLTSMSLFDEWVNGGAGLVKGSVLGVLVVAILSFAAGF